VCCRRQVHWEEGVYFGNYPGAQFPVGEFGNQPVGRLCLARWTREIRVIDIALIPAARGQGIGGALLRQIIDDGEQLSRR
jgi:GNAT superfamily N-acetyltransferase